MELNLVKDLITFDIESTGLSVSKDRIVQISLTKLFADGREPVSRTRLLNPTIPIPPQSSAIHKITDEMVKSESTFKQVSKGLLDFIGDADFLTFNGNRFDIPLLMEEFERAGNPLDMTGRRCLDAQRVFHKMEPRTLSAAYRFYVGGKLEGAHDASKDVAATLAVFKAQLDKYQGVDGEDKNGNVIPTPVRNDMQAIHDFTNDPNEMDFAGKIVRNEEGVPVFTFGKFQGKPVGESLAGDYKYHNWIRNGDFSTQTKKLCDRLVQEFLDQRNG